MSLPAQPLVSAFWYNETREMYFGIPVSVRFTPANPQLARRIWAALEAINGEFNDYSDTSCIGRINAAGPGTYLLPPPLEEAFALADRLRATTNGSCEITVGALRRLWKGAARSGIWPTDAQIEATRATVGAGTYRREGNRLTVLVPGVAFDFGGVCKGLAIDRATALLRAAGCAAALVQIGGESCCWGLAPAGRPHRLAIPHPDAPDDLARSWAQVQDPGTGMGGSTSGNYRMPVIVQDRELYHIYDPRTGIPADTQILSFTVILPGAGRNGEADVLTKSGILLGEEGLAIVAAAGGEAMLLRRGEGKAVTACQTPGWSRYLTA